MQNNIPTLYILELGSSVVKSAKISTILCHLSKKFKKNIDRKFKKTLIVQCGRN